MANAKPSIQIAEDQGRNSEIPPPSHLNKPLPELSNDQNAAVSENESLLRTRADLVPRPYASKNHERPFRKSIHTYSITSLNEESGPIDCCDEVSGDENASLPLWTPLWLRSSTLFLLMTLFTLLLLALLLLRHFAKANNGFSTQLSTNHYAWTYGPTAILVVVVGFWRQVDYYCKILSPWKVLSGPQASASTSRKGFGRWLPSICRSDLSGEAFAGPSRSLFLDYLSPIQISSFRLAVKNRHFAVMFSVIGFALLKLIVLFSTGLLVLNPTTIYKPRSPLVTTTKLYLNNWNSSLLPGELLTAVSNSPTYAYYGTLAHGLPFPKGTEDGIWFQTIEEPQQTSRRNNGTISASVDAFVPAFNCEVAKTNWSYPQRIPVNGTLERVDQFYATVEASSTLAESYTTPITVLDPWFQETPPRQWRPMEIYPYHEYWVLVLADISYSQVIQQSQPTFNVSDASLTVNGVTAIVCEPSYSVKKVNVTYDTALASTSGNVNITMSETSQTNSSLQERSVSDGLLHARDFNFTPPALITTLTSDHGVLANFSNMNLSDVVRTSISWAELFGDPLDGIAEPPDTTFKLMSIINNNRNYSYLMDGETMARSALGVFAGVAVQFVRQNLTASSNETIVGQLTYQEDRLFVRESSVWAMVAGFALMVLLTAMILIHRPYRVCPSDPDSIRSMAAVLANSKELQNLLIGTGGYLDDELKTSLDTHQYRSKVYSSALMHGATIRKNPEAALQRISGSSNSITARILHLATDVLPWTSNPHEQPAKDPFVRTAVPAFGIEASRIHYDDAVKPNGANLVWWRPFVLKWPSVGLILALPLVLIGSLEAVQRVSDHHDGFAAVSSSPSWGLSTSAYISYIPALVMLLVAALFNSLDFTVSVFAPYSRLQAGNASARRTLMSRLLGKTPPLVLIELLKTRRWGALMSTLAGLIGSVLTIIVSGLYLVESVPGTTGAVVQRIDMFDFNWATNGTLGDDNTAAVVLSLVEHLNMSYPQFTFDELALPDVTFTTHLQNDSQASLTVQLPAWRASLNCTVFPSDALNITYSGEQSNITSLMATVQAHTDRPIDVASHCQLDALNDSSSNYLNYSTSLLVSTVRGVYAGALRDLPGNPEGCPSLAFTFGYFEFEKADPENVTAMVCHQNLEEVGTNVTFSLPYMSIDPVNPPIPDIHNVTHLTNGTGDNTFVYRLQNNVETQLASFNQGGVGATAQTGRDSFIDTVLFGSEGIPPSELVGVANQGKFINATNHVYRKYMAQAISLNMRKNYTGVGEPPLLEATLHELDHRRLKQEAGSKLTLQILLGVMFACGSAAYLLTDMRSTLPHNPCSIAGTMSLLAGSDVLDRHILPEGSEWLTDKEMAASAALQGHTFGMGWKDINGKQLFVIHAEEGEKGP